MFKVLFSLLLLIYYPLLSAASNVVASQPAVFVKGQTAFEGQLDLAPEILALPSLKAMVMCTATVSASSDKVAVNKTRGDLAQVRCWTKGPRLLAKAVMDALDGIEVRAAQNESGNIRVKMNFSVLIHYQQGALKTLLLPNHLLNKLGVEYISAQRISPKIVDLNACPQKDGIFVTAKVGAKGEFQGIESIQPKKLHRACIKVLTKLMRRSVYVATRLNGAAVAAIYRERFNNLTRNDRYKLDLRTSPYQ